MRARAPMPAPPRRRSISPRRASSTSMCAKAARIARRPSAFSPVSPTPAPGCRSCCARSIATPPRATPWWRSARQSGRGRRACPPSSMAGRVLVGFDDAEHVGAELLRLLDEAPAAAARPGGVGPVRHPERERARPAAVHPGARPARRLQPLRDVGTAVPAVAAGEAAGPPPHGDGRRHLRARQRRGCTTPSWRPGSTSSCSSA
jgi:hypothetical protein